MTLLLRLLRPFFLAMLIVSSSVRAQAATAPAHGPGACALKAQERESPAAHAVACAEDFVRRNGYTVAAATPDTSQLAPEAIEWTRDRTEWLRRRRNTLRPRALAVCAGVLGGDSTGFTVIFLAIPDSLSARSVSMTADFMLMEVDHQNVNLTYVRRPGSPCQSQNAP